jgi:hypothetical protein
LCDAPVRANLAPMDPVTLSYYAVVCGTLGFLAPRLGRPFKRLVVGVVVGVVAAGALPLMRGAFAF